MLHLDRKPATTPAIPDWAERFSELHDHTHHDRLRAFYGVGVVSGDTPLAEVPFVALDFETTGLNPERDGIVSIGLVPMTLARIQCSAARHWVVNPRRVLQDESVVIHGITHSDIAEAPDLMDILDELLTALAGRIVVVHHHRIERQFLDAALKVRINEGIQFPVVDTMELEGRLHRQRPPSFWDKLLRRPQPSIRLADSRTRYHLPYYQPHHALTDALASAELLQAQIAHHYTPDTPIKSLW
ncbi:MAG: 3'-5' exonuclease [Natronospirillum sp.]